jgi:hypothetical protein
MFVVGSEAEAADMMVAGEGLEEAEAGMPVTMSRLCSPLVNEETLKALRSVICAGADQIILEVLDDGAGGRGGDGVADAVTIDVAVSVTTTVLVLVVAAREGGNIVEVFDKADDIEARELVLGRAVSEGE